MFRASSIFTFLLWVLFCKLVVSETLQRYISELEDQIEGEQGKSFRSRHLLKELQQEIQTLEREFATSERILFQYDQEKEILATKYAKLESDFIRLEIINKDLTEENKLLNKHADDITISYARKLHADDIFQDMNKHYGDMIIDLEDRLQKGIFKSSTGTMKEELHTLEAELRLLRESLQFQREHVIGSLVKILDGTGSSKDVQQLIEDLLSQVAELKASLESEKHAKSGAIKQKNILLSQLEKMNNILTTQEDELSLLRNTQTTPVIPYTPRPSFSSIVTLNVQ